MTDVVEVYMRSGHPEDPPEFDWRRKQGGNHAVIATSGGQGYRNALFCAGMAMRVNGPDVLYRLIDESASLGWVPIDYDPEKVAVEVTEIEPGHEPG